MSTVCCTEKDHLIVQKRLPAYRDGQFHNYRGAADARDLPGSEPAARARRIIGRQSAEVGVRVAQSRPALARIRIAVAHRCLSITSFDFTAIFRVELGRRRCYRFLLSESYSVEWNSNMNDSPCPLGESVLLGEHPISDLDATSLSSFVVLDGATFLLCSLTAQGRRSFPHTDGAQRVEVGPEGVLYSFSTVHVSSSQPVPYTIGYVDFPGDVRVLAKVRGSDHALHCDCVVRLASEGSDWFVEPVARTSQ